VLQTPDRHLPPTALREVDDRFLKYHESARLPALVCGSIHKHQGAEVMLSENLSDRAMPPGAPPSAVPDPILAAIADHRRLWLEYCAAVEDVEETARVNTQTPLFKRQLDAMIAERDRFDKAEKRALAALSKVRPTTAAGAGALVAYIREDLKDSDPSSWRLSALGNVARALATMGVRS
jgi:hypothetical protein